MRRTLDEAAQISLGWLRQQMKPEWLKQYGRRFDGYRLPSRRTERLELAVAIGEDGFYLFEAIFAENGQEGLKTSPKVEILRRFRIQHYFRDPKGKVHWRNKEKWGQPPAGKMFGSPDDIEARYCVKRSTEWTGNKVNFTETYQDEHLRLITPIETTTATVHDVNMTAVIQDDLARRGLTPEI